MPFADVGPTVIPDWIDDEDALLLTDAFSTGYFGAQLGDIVEGDTVVVFGAGPVGLFAAQVRVADGRRSRDRASITWTTASRRRATSPSPRRTTSPSTTTSCCT